MGGECEDDGGLDGEYYDCCDGESEDALGVHGDCEVWGDEEKTFGWRCDLIAENYD